MKKTINLFIFLICIFFLFAHLSSAQIIPKPSIDKIKIPGKKDKDKSDADGNKKKIGDVTKGVGDIGKNVLSNRLGINVRKWGIEPSLLGNALAEVSQKFDATSFNYSMSLSDNSGLYENQNLGKEAFQKGNAFIQKTNTTQESPLQQASGQNQFGEMQFAGYRFESAEKSYNSSLSLLEGNSLIEKPLYSLVLSNMGLLYETTGRYQLAEEFTKKAINIRKQSADTIPEAYAASLNNLSVLYKNMGRYDESETTIEDALKYQAKVKDGTSSLPYALMLNNKAVLLQMLGRYNEAEPVMLQAIDVADKKTSDKSSVFQRYQTNLAFLYKEMGKYEKAAEIYEKALKIVGNRLGKDHPDYATLLNNTAALYMLTGKLDKVEKYLNDAAAIYKKKFTENHPAYAQTIFNLGSYYRSQGKLSNAETLLKQALDIRKNTLGDTHPDYLNSTESMALLKWQQNQPDEAALFFKETLDKELDIKNSFFPSMSEVEKGKFWDRISPKFHKFNAFAVQAGAKKPEVLGWMYNYQLATKALLLSNANRIRDKILNGNDATLKKQYINWIDGKKILANVYTLSKDERKEQNINRDSLEKALNTLEKQISAKVKFSEPSYSYKDIQAKLTADAAAIEIIRFQKFYITSRDSVFYAALVLTKDKTQPQLVLMENGKEMESKLFAYYKNALTKQLSDKSSYKQFFEKTDVLLGNKKTIYLSLDGIYNQINISTLLKPNGKYLFDEKNFIILTNTKDLVTNKVTASGKPDATLVGDPAYGTEGTIASLPDTKKEIDGTKKILQAKGYTTREFMGTKASENNIKTIANPKILHFATHGYFLKDVDEDADDKIFGVEPEKAKEMPLLRSGLFLANSEATLSKMDTKQPSSKEDGLLNAYEVMNMPLEQTDIVVMSACETGLGDIKNGEGVYGLQRAFQVAGAKSLLMSLWKVNSEATQELMRNFFTNLNPQGTNKVQAFKMAQTQLKAKFPNPYYWGAFVMVGN
jgi:CHAT domain-containing protein/Tfp pilus assembly protein PilF